MPVYRGKNYYRFGKLGKKYAFVPGNRESERTAYLQMLKQARAIEFSKRQKGEGVKEVANAVVSKVKNVVDAIKGIRTHAGPKFRSFLSTNGNAKITKIVVSRKPIISAIDRIASWISGGKWDENKKALQYDKVFHLFLTITLDNGKTFKLEKNHVPEIGAASSKVEGQDDMSVRTPNVTLAQFIANGEKKAGSDRLWVYDAVSQNCQYFVKWLLEGSRVWSPALNTFVMQNTERLIENLPWFKKVARTITDTANRIDVAIEGRGRTRTNPIFISLDLKK